MTNQQNNQMPRPNTDLDFQAQLTDPFTSSPYVDPSFSDKFRVYAVMRDQDGNVIYDENNNPKIFLETDLWGILQIFNRDWRLGNIDKKEEAVFIRHHINLSTDILNLLGDEFKQASLICLSYALCVNETSQAKGGFLRRMLNTFIHKTNTNDEDSTKKKGGIFSSFSKSKY